jgi:hypothetical protein
LDLKGYGCSGIERVLQQLHEMTGGPRMVTAWSEIAVGDLEDEDKSAKVVTLRCSIPGREEEMGKRLGGHSKQEKMEN